MAEFNLKTALAAVRARRTDAQVEEQEQRNAQGRSRLNPDSAQNRIARASQYEQDTLANLALARQMPDGPEKESRLSTLFDRLGELAAEQGDHSRAATISQSPERREHYRSMVKAIRRDDDEKCDCQDDMVIDRINRQEFRSPAIIPVDTIVGPGGQLLTLHQCRHCGHRNAK